MGIDQSKIKAARGPLTAALVLGIAVSWAVVAPRGTKSADVKVETGDSVLVVPTTIASATTVTSTTLAPRNPDLPEATGGLSPEWPEWVQVAAEEKTTTSYTATLKLTEGGMTELLVWLSMQRWTATSSSPDSASWELAAGRAAGTLERAADGTFTFSVTR